MVKEQKIAVHVRLRPTKAQKCTYSISSSQRLEFNVPKERAAHLINNSKDHFEFQFESCFDTQTKQDEVFDSIAKPTLDSALNGFNGTIFAYGQTGSGKTYTMTGGPSEFRDRGIIPRALQYIFSQFKKRTDYVHQVHVSYMEIYQDKGYDLLGETDDKVISKGVTLPKVTLREDNDGNILLRGLSAFPATNEEEALNYLFLGDTNRTVSETSMNLESSRSHCIFTILISATQVGSDVVRRSKVHLVDLAGSERVHKSHATDKTLNEAMFINSSLHFLEMVIIALQERARGKKTFVPYRNSLMTSVLRDSLGGNCKTSMIATINPDEDHLAESMSTCRFAQRVAMVSNAVAANEEVDPSRVIVRLRKEIEELKEEISMLKGDAQDSGELDADTVDKIRHMVVQWVDDPSPESMLSVGADMSKIRFAFMCLKDLVLQSRKGVAEKSSEMSNVSSEQVSKLQLQLQQRNNEISILVNMLNKPGQSFDVAAFQQAATMASQACPPLPGGGARFSEEVPSSSSSTTSASSTSSASAALSGASTPSLQQPASNSESDAIFDAELLKDRNKAFDVFRRSYRKNQQIEASKAALKKKFEEAQSLGEIVRRSKGKVGQLRALLEQRRVEHAMHGLSEGKEDAPDPEEERLRSQMESERVTYKEKYERLRELKGEIEYMQLSLEKSRVQLTRDFESWFKIMERQQGGGSQQTARVTQRAASTHGTGHSPQKGAMTLPKQTLQIGSSSEEQSGSFTGNAEADADIMAFYKARETLMAKQQAASR